MNLFGFFKKNSVSLDASKSSLQSQRERYGKASLEGFKTADWSEAIAEFQELESEGFGEASVALGQMAQGVDESLALEHFRKAASAGLAEGMWGVAALLGHGYIADISGEDKEWYKYCLAAAQSGCGDAMHELGKHYHHTNDILAAFYWFQLASWYECKEADYSVSGLLLALKAKPLGVLSTSIDGVPSKNVKGATFVLKAYMGLTEVNKEFMDDFMLADQEEQDEFRALFFAHFFEDIVCMNGNARLCFEYATRQASIIGTKSYGDMLAVGKGCEKDFDKAMTLYKQAAEAGEKTACFVMGQYMQKTNRNEAAYWYTAAFRRGYGPALDAISRL